MQLSYHVRNLEVSVGKHDGVGWSGHGQHEGEGGAQSTGEHDIQRVEANGARLGKKKTHTHTVL